MAQALGIFDTASGQVAGALGVVDFGPQCFSGHPPRSSFLTSEPEKRVSTIWIAAGVDADDGSPGAGGTMPDARVFSKGGTELGKSIHDKGVSAGDTNHIVIVHDGEPNEVHYTLFSGNRGSGNSLEHSVCIAWTSIHWPGNGPRYASSGGWGRACEKWGAQWYYSGMTVPGSDDYTPDCLWVHYWDQRRGDPYPPGTNQTHPPVQGFHINWHDMKIQDYDRRINTSAQALCDTRTFRLYRYHDPQKLELRPSEIHQPPSIVPTSHYTNTEGTTTQPSTTEDPTTEPTTTTTSPTTEPTGEPTTDTTAEPTTDTTAEPTTEPTGEPTEEPTTTTDTSKPNPDPSPTTTTETGDSSDTQSSTSSSTNTSPGSSTTTTETGDGSDTSSTTSSSNTTSSGSSTTTETFTTKTVTVDQYAARLNKRQGRRDKQHRAQNQRHQQQAQAGRSHPAAQDSHSKRSSSVPEKFSNLLVINDHAHQTASALCSSQNSLGPSFADARTRLYCDMETKTLYPFCKGDEGEGGGKGVVASSGGQPAAAGRGEEVVCFDFGGSNMLRGPGVQKRQAPRVQDWRVRRGRGGR